MLISLAGLDCVDAHLIEFHGNAAILVARNIYVVFVTSVKSYIVVAVCRRPPAPSLDNPKPTNSLLEKLAKRGLERKLERKRRKGRLYLRATQIAVERAVSIVSLSDTAREPHTARCIWP
jgi:hypothetical protein